MELFRALTFPVEYFSNITLDIKGISGFKILLCPSVLRVASVTSDSKVAALKWKLFSTK